jgi:Origin of replication binding protein
MLIAVSRLIVNKPGSRDFREKKLSGTFENLDLSLDEIAAEVSQGHAICAQHTKRWRRKENFLQTGFLAVDIDDGLTIEDALSDSFVQAFGGLIYTSPSHTEEAHRFRIVFELEQPITDIQTMEHAYTGLIRKFGADASCKDACRMFFGNTQAQIQMPGGKPLPAHEVEALVLRGAEAAFTKDTLQPTASGPPTVHSRLVIDPETRVVTASGTNTRLVDLPSQTAVHCPVHVDRNPSAFSLRSKQGTPGVHCVTCKATFFIRSEGPYYDFDYELQALRPLQRASTLESITRQLAERKRSESADRHEPAITPPVVQLSLGGVIDAGKHTGVSFISEQFLPPVETDADVILVKSPKGSGKTEWLKRIVLDARKASQSVLLIGHRQSLIMSTAKRLGLTAYIDIMKADGNSGSHVRHVKPTDYYAICIDSLPLRVTPQRHKYDIILIDEVEQVLAHLTSDTLRDNRHGALMMLAHYLRRSKKVYALDADLNRATGICIPELIGESKKTAFVVVNDWTTIKGAMNLYEDRGHLVHELLQQVTAGKRCFICSNSKKTIHQLTRLIAEEFHGTKKLMTITAENSQTPEAQAFLLGLPSTCLEYDCVLVSPAVGTGVDITFPQGESKIDAVFGFFVALVNTHFDIDQQLCRVRHPGAVNVWVSPQKFSLSTDQRVIEAELLQTANRNFRTIGYDADGAPKYSDADRLYVSIFSEVSALRRASKNNFRQNFCNLRKRSGWEVVTIPKEEDASERGKELVETARSLVEAAQRATLLNIRPISESEYATLIKKSKHGSVSADEEAGMRRYEIERFYSRAISKELIEDDRDGAYREEIRLFELLECNENELDNWWLRLQSDTQVHQVMEIDINETKARKRLLIKLFESAGIYEHGRGFNCEIIITQDVLTDFVATCRKERAAIERLLDISLRKDLAAKTTRQLSVFLGLVGLAIQKSGTRKQGESKIYLYRISADSLAKILAEVQRRRDPTAKTEWGALQEQRFPDDPETERLMDSIRARRQRAVSRAVEEMDSEDSDPEDFIDLDLAEVELDAKAELYGRDPDEAPLEPDF